MLTQEKSECPLPLGIVIRYSKSMLNSATVCNVCDLPLGIVIRVFKTNVKFSDNVQCVFFFFCLFVCFRR